MKSHRDFVVYVRGGEDINALVISSRSIITPATQTEEAFATEHLALVYLEPGTYSPLSTGEQVRNSIKIALDVKPFVEGGTFGWKEVDEDTTAFTAAIQWREYAAALENSIIAEGHKIPRIASDESRTTPPTDEEAQGSGSERYGDGDFAGKDDPYSIGEMTKQSPLVPTQAAADAVNAEFEAEKVFGGAALAPKGTIPQPPLMLGGTAGVYQPDGGSYPQGSGPNWNALTDTERHEIVHRLFATLTNEERANLTYPFGDIVNASGKTEADLVDEAGATAIDDATKNQ